MVEPRVNVTKFGDGYEARLATSINSVHELWTLTFTRSASEIAQMTDFLKARKAQEAFVWTTPFGDLLTFVCRKWNCTTDKGIVSLHCDFEQVFEAA